MTEWLVGFQSGSRFQRVIADDLETISRWLKAPADPTVFSQDARAYRFAGGRVLETRARLPLDVHLAWWVARHPRALTATRAVVWVGSAALLIARLSGARLPPAVLLLAGASGIAAWWGWELEVSRLEPVVVNLNSDA